MGLSTQSFSLLMSVYHKEKPEDFRQCLESLLNATILPNQFVLVKDGVLTDELETIIEDYRSKFQDFTVLSLRENQGLGVALQKGLLACKYDLVARFDSDDLVLSDRFSLQLRSFRDNESLQLVGGQIQEFSDTEITGTRQVPTSYLEIVDFARKRNPFNHMTVMFRKSTVLEVGSYKPLLGFEDYYLWLRLLKAGYQAENLSDVLVLARAGDGMIGRRSGMAYAKQIITAYRTFYQEGLIDRKTYLSELLKRLFASLLPQKLLVILYRRLLRGK